MKRTLSFVATIAVVSALLLLCACSKATGTTTPDAPPAKGNEQATASTAQAKTKAKELAGKAWVWLDKQYNRKATSREDLGGWGPDCLVPYSAMVVHGALRCGLMKADDQRVKDTIQGIMKQQRPDGAFDIGGNGQNAVYATSLVVSTLSWLRDKGGDFYKGKFDDPIRKSMDYLRHAQVGAKGSPMADAAKDKSFAHGGWAYSKEELEKAKADGKPLANLSTSIFALDAANAFGVKPDDPLWTAAITFLERNHNTGEVDKGIAITMADGKRVVEPGPDSPHSGGARYSPDSSKAGEDDAGSGNVILRSYGSMTYALLRGYLMSGLNKSDHRVRLAFQWLTRNFSVTNVPGMMNTEKDPTADQSGLYYQYYQIGKTLKLYGAETFKDGHNVEINWRSELVNALAERQNKEDGSWANPKKDRWFENFPLLATAYVLGALGDVME